MNTTNLLLVINSLLLGLISLLFVVIGYFLKDLHKDFKHMMERVNKLHAELHTHVTLFEKIANVFQGQIDSVTDRVKKIESFLFKSKEPQK